MAREPRRNSERRQRRIAIMPYGASDSVNALKAGLEEAGHLVVKLNRETSLFRGRPTDMIINWGNSIITPTRLELLAGGGQILNNPENIRHSANKRLSFIAMADQNVPTVEYTNRREVAQGWLDAGELVYARTRISGHSGEGIVMVHNEPDSITGVGQAFEVVSELPQAVLYTKGITEQRREFRIHVMGGVVTSIQQKKRANGWRENPAFSNVVRNYHTGWIYASDDVSPNAAAIDAAIRAVDSLNLDFGAVDIITRRDNAWVLEVNTAPGLQGTNLQSYVDNFSSMFNTGAFIPMEVNVREPMGETHETVPSAVEPDLPTVSIPVAEPVSQRQVAPAPNRVTIRNGAFFRATVRGERTIVQYNSEVDGYYMPGWEIPMNAGDEGFSVETVEIEL